MLKQKNIKEERISELVKKGYFVQDVESILSLSDIEFQQLINSLSKTSIPKILSREDVLEILSKTKKEKIFNIEIIHPLIKNKISTFDVLNILKERYSFLSSIIKKKLSFFNLISINKISKRYKTFSIIGCVYDIKENRVVLDDFSSKIEIYVSEEKNVKFLTKDCVIGVKCRWEGDKIVSDEILFPEFETKQNKKILEVEMEFFKKMEESKNIETENGKIVFVLSKQDSVAKNNVVFLNENVPVHKILIEKDFFVIIVDNFKVTFDIDRFFKQRLIESEIEKTLKFGFDIFLVKEIPDLIIVINSEKNKIEERNKSLICYTSREVDHFGVDLKNKNLKIF